MFAANPDSFSVHRRTTDATPCDLSTQLQGLTRPLCQACGTIFSAAGAIIFWGPGATNFSDWGHHVFGGWGRHFSQARDARINEEMNEEPRVTSPQPITAL